MDGSERNGDHGNGNDECLGDYIIEEMESFWLDIDERFTIYRMVSDTVIKGMVNDFKQQAAERIAQKELEVVGLKKMLGNCRVVSDESKISSSLSILDHEPHKAAAARRLSDSVVEQDRLIELESVDSLQIAVNEQLRQLKKEINKIRGASSVRRISSGSDLVGLGGILQENVPERWIYVDKTFESLKDALDTFCGRMAMLSKVSLSEWQEEQEFRSEIEHMVISNCIWSLQEFEQKLWNLYDSESRNWFNQRKEISSLRQELDSVFKTLSVSEIGQLISHGSLENGEERCSNKRADHFHRKLPTNHVSPSTSEENGKQEDSNINKPENLDAASLKHMTRDELIAYYNKEISEMRRDHESEVDKMTEENFRLKRDLLNLKERGSSLPSKKDKDFDSLKKKIPDVISKLDKILLGAEKVYPFSENIESFSSLKDRFDFLHSENHQLKDMLVDKKEECKSLSSELSAALENLSQKQLTEQNLVQTIQKLEGDIVDAHAELSVIQDVYKCLFEEITSEFRCITEELPVKNSIREEIYEVIFKETARNAQASSGLDIEEEDIESTMMLGLLDVIFKEALMDAKKALKLEALEKEKLKQEMLTLTSIVEEKEELAQEAAEALVQEKRKMELASEERNRLRAETVQQQKLIAENNKELDVTKGDLIAALEEVEQYKAQTLELNQNLERRKNELREIDEERRLLRDVTQKKQDALTLMEAEERETMKQMGSIIALVHKLLTTVSDFEARVNEDISRNCLRLENMSSEFHCLSNKANKLKTKGLMYKQRLETRCSDLAKAEAEVDLLGDEVDTLLDLLEKIYIALDHYSPILQHYPGIIEILELVRRELSGESRKFV